MEKVSRVSTGLQGLDEILHGGLISKKLYLIQGGPGTGKSTVGLHFLSQAIEKGENALYITLGESKESMVWNASQVNIDLSDVTFLDLSPQDDPYKNSNSYSVFTSAEVEQGPIMESIIKAVEKYEPSRVVMDSITMLRFLNQDPIPPSKACPAFFICWMKISTILNGTKTSVRSWVILMRRLPG